MNKIKILLTAVTVITVVGGALAFKSSKFGIQYCTKDSSGQCTSYLTTSKVVNAPAGSLFWAIQTTDTQNCTKTTAPDCTSQLRLGIED